MSERRSSEVARGLRLFAGFVMGRPIHCIVQVSNRCNLSCQFCTFWENPAPPRDELSLADFEGISRKLAEGGSMVVSIEGGEPLLRPDITGIVRAFARHHHPILFTNGWRVTPELARALWEAGLTEIGVSIDHADAARHDAQRGKAGTFEAALRALAILRETAPHGRRQVTVMTVVHEQNADELEALLRLSAEHGVNHQCTLISTSGDARHDRGPAAPPPGTGERLVALKARYPHFVSFSAYLEGIDPYLRGGAPAACDAGRRFLNVDHLGEVSPCIEKLHLSVGNLRREPWSVIAARLAALEETRACNACHTSCKGFVESMSGAPSPRAWRELLTGFSTVGSGRAVRALGRRP